MTIMSEHELTQTEINEALAEVSAADKRVGLFDRNQIQVHQESSDGRKRRASVHPGSELPRGVHAPNRQTCLCSRDQ